MERNSAIPAGKVVRPRIPYNPVKLMSATNTTKIYQGDLVTQGTAGIVTRVARADGGSATSALILGVFNGCLSNI